MIHLAALGYQSLVERLEQRHQPLETIGERTGRQVQAVTGEVGEEPLRGPAEGKLVQQHGDPDGHSQLTFGDEFGGSGCADNTWPAAATAGGAIAVPTITTAVSTDFDLQQFTVRGAGKRREGLAAVRTLLLVRRQFQFLKDNG